MQNHSYKAFYIQEKEGAFIRSVEELNTENLPANEVLIRVYYSSLNYKDALSASGNKGVTRRYPHTPGIDAAGIVEESANPDFKPGDQVIATSYDLGMNTPGGFGQYIRVPAQWVLPLPAGLSLAESMMLGTAGLTAAMSVEKLQKAGVMPGKGAVVVTGASGGVGSIAVNLLSQLGYEVLAVTGKPENRDYFLSLGAGEILPREEITKELKRPLLKPLWQGAIDTVGGEILAGLLKQILPGGAVAACGNAASFELNTTVFPFILRGVSLLGIDSAEYPRDQRIKVWQKLAQEWKPTRLAQLNTEVPLTGLDEKINLMLAGKLQGKVYIKL